MTTEIPSTSSFKAKLILFLFAFLLYANTIPFDYALDDKIYILQNEFTKKGLGGIKDILTTDLFAGIFKNKNVQIAGGRYRPLSLATFAVEYQFFGTNPHIGHTVNALLYGFTAILIFIILNKLFPSAKSQIVNFKSEIFTIPFLTTVLFIAHPLHTEVIANIKSRDELMSFIGALAALYFVLKYTSADSAPSAASVKSASVKSASVKSASVKSASVKSVKNYKYLFYSSLCFFGALLSKETTVTFLVIIPLTVYFFTNQGFKKNLFSVAPLVIVLIIYMALRYVFLGGTKTEPVEQLMNDPFLYANASEKFGTIFFTMGLYLRLLFFPHPLTHDYYPWHPLANDSYMWGNGIMPYIEIVSWKALLPLLLYLGLFIYALTGLKKKSIFSYGILFFLTTFFLTSNLIFPIGTFMNERFMYIPSLGFCLILAHLLLTYKGNGILAPSLLGRAGTGILFVLVIFYSVKTFSRNHAWKDDATLAITDANTSKNSARVREMAGGALLDKARAEKNPTQKMLSLNESVKYLLRSLELYYNPTNMHLFMILGEAYYEKNDYTNSIVFFGECLKNNNNYEGAVNYLLHIGDTCTKTGQFDMAIKSLTTLVNYNKNVLAYQMLGELYGKNMGNLTMGLEYLNKALEIDTANINTLYKIGVVHAIKGEPQKAIEIFSKALEAEPDNAHILMNLGSALIDSGQKEKGEALLKKAFELNPGLRKK